MQSSFDQWSSQEVGTDRLICEVCPRRCSLNDGDRGFCFVRQRVGDSIQLSTYGRSTGFCIDPIEKKPLFHFYPGTSVLSFGTAGCNLGCKFCQNWDISKSRQVERLSQQATPYSIAEEALKCRCGSVAFTYNDPVIWAEYAIDTANECRSRGIKSVAVTAGYISERTRGPFFEAMDAANIDLKGFTEEFYWKTTSSHLQPVLETLKYVANETSVWLEITNLIIPGKNDSPQDIQSMCEWIVEYLGPDVPLHFSAFHPDFRMLDTPNTPHQTLIDAYLIAKASGINYCYVGNVHDSMRQSTYCPRCNALLIRRDWHATSDYKLVNPRTAAGRGDDDFGKAHAGCQVCGCAIVGRFESEDPQDKLSGNSDWKPRWRGGRLPIYIPHTGPV